jgi:hypothetical protein
MSTYLLLRNNKETGPFTIEEIRELSLKSYDLVWTVGKSAAWRYPGEIPEFRSFAPAVPEQAQDIPGKKKASESMSSDAVLSKKPDSQNIKGKESGIPRMAASQSVYVNLPAEKKPAVVSSLGVLYDSDVQQESSTTYDFSDIYRKKPSRVVRLSGRLIWIFSILLLFGTGIITGFFISDRRKIFTIDANHTQSSPAQPPAAIASPGILTSSHPAYSTLSNPTIDRSQALPPVVAQLGKTGGNSGKKSQKNVARKDSLSSLSNDKSIPSSTDSSQKQNTTGKTESLDQKVKANPENYVDLVTGHFSTGLFGGISAVPITVTNNSPVIMDQVTVTVAYIQSNNKVFKTEDISFSDLEPGESLTEKAPKSPRGIKITTRIRQITSRKLDLNYSK